MSSNHEDPNAREIHEAQLTAYALGQLNAKEREATEALVARSEKTRQFVEETAVLASHVRQACQQAPAPEASASLRGAIEKRFQTEPDVERATLNQAKPVAPKRSRRKLLWVVGMAGCAACAMVALLLPAVQSARESARRISDLKPVRDPAYSGSEQTASAEPKSDRDSEFWYRDSIPGADSFRALKRLSEPKSSERGKDATLMARTGSDTPMGDKSLAQDPYVGKPPSAVPGDSQPQQAVLRSGISSELAAGKHGYGPSPYYMQDDVQYSLLPKKSHLPSSIDQSRENEGREISGPGYSPSPGTEQYDQTADNNFRSVARQPLSTCSIDVDTASYANVRRFLTEGRLPPSEAVRIE